MPMILLYTVTSTHFTSLLPCLSGHLSHLFPNTDQMPTFFQDTSCLVMSLCSYMYLPCSELLPPHNLCLDSSCLSHQSQVPCFLPHEAFQSPRQCLLLLPLCSSSPLFRLCFSTGCFRELLLWAMKPSMAGTITDFSLASVLNMGPGIVTSQ